MSEYDQEPVEQTDEQEPAQGAYENVHVAGEPVPEADREQSWAQPTGHGNDVGETDSAGTPLDETESADETQSDREEPSGA